MSKVRHVMAFFGGIEQRLSLDKPQMAVRYSLHQFEDRHGGLFSLLQRLATGTWPVSAIGPLLSHAVPNSRANVLQPTDPAVEGILRRNSPGIYVPLCAKLIEAHLYGLDEAEAKWDERVAIAANNKAAEP